MVYEKKSAKETKQASGNSNFSGKGVSKNNHTCDKTPLHETCEVAPGNGFLFLYATFKSKVARIEIFVIFHKMTP